MRVYVWSDHAHKFLPRELNERTPCPCCGKKAITTDGVGDETFMVCHACGEQFYQNVEN